jgi:hypothetical protein
VNHQHLAGNYILIKLFSKHRKKVSTVETIPRMRGGGIKENDG